MQPASGTQRHHAQIMLVLSAAVAALVAAGMIAFALWSNEAPFAGMAMLLFDLDTEQNIPTWFSTVLLAYLALAAWKLIPRKGSGITRLSYVALASGFLFLSADEAALLHERIGSTVEVGGALANARWIILWLPVLGVCGLVLLAVLWRSAPRLAAGLLIGAVVYLGGAIGVEMINQVNRHGEATRLQQAGVEPHQLRSYSRGEDRYGKDTLVYVAGTAAEEGLEKAGILIWFAVILAAQRRAAGEGRLTISGSRSLGRDAASVEVKPAAAAQDAERVAAAR